MCRLTKVTPERVPSLARQIETRYARNITQDDRIVQSGPNKPTGESQDITRPFEDGSGGTVRHRFLVVDDDRDVLDALRRLFRKDYELFLASDADEGFRILEEHDVQVVMSDQRMPEMSGVEFLTNVRTRFPKAVRILFTGYGDANAVIEAINEGHVYRYIAKPFEPAELKAVVAQATDYYDIRAERERLLEELAERNVELRNGNRELALAYDELKTLDRLKTVFMEIVSHELNTPTAIILGYASLLQRGTTAKDPEAFMQAMQGIKASGLRMKGITEKIGKMMAADLTAIELNLEEVDVSALVTAIVAELDPVLKARKQRIDVESDGDSTISAERAHVRDLLLNLIVNAIKFSADGSTIWVSLSAWREYGRDELLIRVRDEGVGIRPEDREQIFSSFFGTFDSRHHSSGDFGFEQRGIGLGLAIVKRFAEMHGGSVEFDSVLGEGTEFRVIMPREPRLSTAELSSV